MDGVFCKEWLKAPPGQVFSIALESAVLPELQTVCFLSSGSIPVMHFFFSLSHPFLIEWVLVLCTHQGSLHQGSLHCHQRQSSLGLVSSPLSKVWENEAILNKSLAELLFAWPRKTFLPLSFLLMGQKSDKDFCKLLSRKLTCGKANLSPSNSSLAFEIKVRKTGGVL